MLKKIIAAISFLILINNYVFAEGIWDVNGYQLSNVHAWQQNGQIAVGGRVTSGPPCNIVVITIHTSSNLGEAATLIARIPNYKGNGELFETQTYGRNKSGIWKIDSIDVTGGKINNTPITRANNKHSPYTLQNESVITPTKPTTFKTFENQKQTKIENPSKVLFTNMNFVNIIVKNKETNKVELIKNIDPHRLEEIEMKKGNYKAKIIGTNISKEIEFSIKYPSETIELN